ncbi:MAG: CAP domain-containing protein [Solirubrobacteraceae bacterium]
MALLPTSLALWLGFGCQAALARHTHVAEYGQQSALTPVPLNPSLCPGAKLAPQSSNLPTVRSATLCLVNQERALHGESPLHPNRQLTSSAENHTREMVTHSFFSHDSPDGQSPLSRMSACGYITDNPRIGFMVGENIAWGTYGEATPQAIVQSWIESPPHLANILNGRFRDTAIGVLAAAPSTTQPGATYTEDFGVIIR